MKTQRALHLPLTIGADAVDACASSSSVPVSNLVFVKQDGFPRRWAAMRCTDIDPLGVIVQEHERSERGKSVFRYRAALLAGCPLGSFATLRRAKQAIKEELGA